MSFPRLLLASFLGALLPSAASAAGPVAQQELIDRAIARGVAHLRDAQAPDGSWMYAPGATPLAGFTLLQCGVSADDPAVRLAAQNVRAAAPGASGTYEIALSILFLDLLADPGDVPIIQALGVRLLAGQTPQGGWSYQCPLPRGDAERDWLDGLVRLRQHAVANQKPPAAGAGNQRRDPAAPVPAGVPKVVALAPEVDQSLAEYRHRLRTQAPAPLMGGDDNSNTQFAILGLWTARRSGVPVTDALELVGRRFRLSQSGDGGWGYTPISQGLSTPAMTCAGLLGLAVGSATTLEARAIPKLQQEGAGKAGSVKQAPRDVLNKDPALRAGLLALGTAIGVPNGRIGNRRMPGAVSRGYYFLWSLERVGVAFDLRTIGTKDWYAWGSELILVSQDDDGGWRGQYPQGGVDTCFALLFLRRANVAVDLTARLRGRFEDPGTVRLQSGGVGGAGLQGGRPKQGLGVGVSVNPAPAAEEPEKPAPPGPAKPTEPSKPSAPAVPQNQPGPDSEPRQTPSDGSAPSDPERLRSALVDASPQRQEHLIEQYVDGKGVVYTDALAAAVPHLAEPVRSRAREGLALRLARMTPATLRDKLTDQEPEIRRAAALAFAVKEDLDAVPWLIAALRDPIPAVARAAHVSLKTLSKQDFGPPRGATSGDFERASRDWAAWWESRR